MTITQTLHPANVKIDLYKDLEKVPCIYTSIFVY